MSSKHALLTHRTKGVPGGTAPFALEEIAAKEWNVLRQDLPLPLAILREPAIANNERWMRQFCENANVTLAPHGKTTMCPDLFRRQLDNGAWAITLSTSHQVQVARDFGVSRILLANQIVDPRFLEFVMSELDEDPDFDFLCLVDSVEGARMTGEYIRARGFRRKLGVLIEIGASKGRTGVRSVDGALRVVDALTAYRDVIELRGVEGFEGIFGPNTPENLAKVTALIESVAEVALTLDERRLLTGSEVVLSAGGSSYYDIVVERLQKVTLSRPVRVVIRSGCYIAHDGIMYHDFFAALHKRSQRVRDVDGGLQAALQVVTYVQSMPEPGMALLSGGKRDLSYDMHLPKPRLRYSPGKGEGPSDIGEGYEIYALADQHAFMRIPEESTLSVGDMVILDISHPCTTFDKWDVLYGVDADYNVVSAYKTYF
jgi:D-serine dehydratase